MFTKKVIYTLLIVLSMAIFLQAQTKGTIVYMLVMDDVKIDPETGEWPDMTIVYLLEDEGYEVIKFYNASLSTADQTTLDTLYNADLIIYGRSVPSLDLGNHKEAWNSITTPTLCLEMWAVRSNRLNWFNTTNMAINTEEGTIHNAIIEKPDDLVFAGLDVSAPVPWVFAPFDAIGTTDAGNGIVLARHELDSTVFFVRFEPDVEFYPGSGDYPAGHRTLIGNGRDNGGQAPFNYYNFTGESEKVFLAEVARMVAIGQALRGVKEKDGARPRTCTLVQNYPNPFNATTNIEFHLSKPGFTTLEIFDIQGKLVKTLVNSHLNPGLHKVSFTANDLSTGVYYYTIHHDGFTDVKKMILIK